MPSSPLPGSVRKETKHYCQLHPPKVWVVHFSRKTSGTENYLENRKALKCLRE
ncbi:12648_t:CDS:2 [Funneliformis mosseae]|uniref:12648_t:CDS:1 n=1 Tax=Funneliformis mosseae TaxID=27381 RepID=A0A9N9GEW7_FUNMO|nr:12648_t:CDS:2 [Funneliformis mosseae]